MKQLSAHKIFEGKQLQFEHRSAVLKCQMPFSIFLPIQAELKPVPVLYWLSGLTCTDQNFVTKAGAQQFASEFGVAIVCPDTSPRGKNVPDDRKGATDFGLGAGFYLNATQEPWRKHYQMYDYVVQELPELIAQNFPVDATRQSIFGHSMGGHGALTIGLKNPDKYRSISAFAPIVSPMHCPWGRKAFRGYLGKNKEAWVEYDSCMLVTQSDPNARLPVLVDQGESDNFLATQLLTDRLIEASEFAAYPMKIHYRPGYDHSYFFISSFIRDHIKFHAGFLKD